jgi:hypothetical protein
MFLQAGAVGFTRVLVHLLAGVSHKTFFISDGQIK